MQVQKSPRPVPKRPVQRPAHNPAPNHAPGPLPRKPRQRLEAPSWKQRAQAALNPPAPSWKQRAQAALSDEPATRVRRAPVNGMWVDLLAAGLIGLGAVIQLMRVVF